MHIFKNEESRHLYFHSTKQQTLRYRLLSMARRERKEGGVFEREGTRIENQKHKEKKD